MNHPYSTCLETTLDWWKRILPFWSAAHHRVQIKSPIGGNANLFLKKLSINFKWHKIGRVFFGRFLRWKTKSLSILPQYKIAKCKHNLIRVIRAINHNRKLKRCRHFANS